MRKVMEPKLIKEETLEKDATAGGFVETPRSKTTKGLPKERCKTPDSPEGARQATTPLSPSQSSPPRNPSSPLVNGTADSLTPPLAASTVLSVGLEVPRGFCAEQQYGYGGPRQLTKVKRFLTTLVQFGNDISQEVGDRVKSLVLNLVSSNLSIEEFHHSLQDVTNFPLRPFVLPFLRTHIPVLQREIHTLARVNKQSALQYVRNHDHVILDTTHWPSEASEIFMASDTATINLKRRVSDGPCENGYNGQPQSDAQDYTPPTPKRSALINQNPFVVPHHHGFFLATAASNSHFFDYSQHAHTNPPKTEEKGDEEWRNIHVMLNCILSMVEKTKRALTILQQRNAQDTTTEWLRKQDVSVDLKKAANEILAQAVRQTEDRVAEVRRRAEEAVNDVKRQAVVELQKAVAAAETKANELVTAERAKMEKLLVEARKHVEEGHGDAVDNSQSPSSQPAPSQQNPCWNCGRKAHETCSGCSIARYCGAFCQHKDWENHHQVCAKDKNRIATPATVTPQSISTVIGQEEVKFKK